MHCDRPARKRRRCSSPRRIQATARWDFVPDSAVLSCSSALDWERFLAARLAPLKLAACLDPLKHSRWAASPAPKASAAPKCPLRVPALSPPATLPFPSPASPPELLPIFRGSQTATRVCSKTAPCPAKPL